MPKAFIQQFASLPPISSYPEENQLVGTKTMTFTKEDDDQDNHYEWLGIDVQGESKFLLGTMTSTANPFEGPDQEQSSAFFL